MVVDFSRLRQRGSRMPPAGLPIRGGMPHGAICLLVRQCLGPRDLLIDCVQCVSLVAEKSETQKTNSVRGCGGAGRASDLSLWW